MTDLKSALEKAAEIIKTPGAFYSYRDKEVASMLIAEHERAENLQVGFVRSEECMDGMAERNLVLEKQLTEARAEAHGCSGVNQSLIDEAVKLRAQFDQAIGALKQIASREEGKVPGDVVGIARAALKSLGVG